MLCSIGIKTSQLRSDGDAKMFMLWQARLFTAHARNARVALSKTRTWWRYWNADVSNDNGMDLCFFVFLYWSNCL